MQTTTPDDKYAQLWTRGMSFSDALRFSILGRETGLSSLAAETFVRGACAALLLACQSINVKKGPLFVEAAVLRCSKCDRRCLGGLNRSWSGKSFSGPLRCSIIGRETGLSSLGAETFCVALAPRFSTLRAQNMTKLSNEFWR